jgi:hypothetical protein
MDETYRMLGAAHEADLERDARKWRRAAEARRAKRDSAVALTGAPVPKAAYLAAFRARMARSAP